MTDVVSFYAFEEYLNMAKEDFFEALRSSCHDSGERYSEARHDMQQALGDATIIGAAEYPQFREALFKWIQQFWYEFEELSKKVHQEMIKEEMEKEHG